MKEGDFVKNGLSSAVTGHTYMLEVFYCPFIRVSSPVHVLDWWQMLHLVEK
jgi:hypothetical protein